MKPTSGGYKKRHFFEKLQLLIEIIFFDAVFCYIYCNYIMRNFSQKKLNQKLIKFWRNINFYEKRKNGQFYQKWSNFFSGGKKQKETTRNNIRTLDLTIVLFGIA